MTFHTRPLTAADMPPRERVADAALLIVDLQNDFVREGAPLEVASARDTIAANQRLIAGFRALGRPVVYTRFLARQDDNLLWLWSRECQPDIRCCWLGEKRAYRDRSGLFDCAAIVDELTPAPDDLVVDKYGYGSFHDTDLDAQLRARGVRSLVVTGTVTQICVEETAREAFHRGYRTTVVSDAVSSFAPDLQAAMLKNFAMKFGWVADSATALSWLEA